MSRKSRRVLEPQLPRFESNEAIEGYVKEKPLFKDSLNEIRLILQREGADKCHWFNKELALDLDDVEKRKRLAQMGKTVDFVVGCVKNTLLMVEAKLRVKNASTLSRKEIEEKIRHSKLLLKSENYSIHSLTALLLRPDCFEQNKNRVYRLFDNRTDVLYPLTVERFYKKVFDKSIK